MIKWKIKSVPLDTGRKLNVHSAFRRLPERILNVFFIFNIHPIFRGDSENPNKEMQFKWVTE